MSVKQPFYKGSPGTCKRNVSKTNKRWRKYGGRVTRHHLCDAWNLNLTKTQDSLILAFECKKCGAAWCALDSIETSLYLKIRVRLHQMLFRIWADPLNVLGWHQNGVRVLREERAPQVCVSDPSSPSIFPFTHDHTTHSSEHRKSINLYLVQTKANQYQLGRGELMTM